MIKRNFFFEPGFETRLTSKQHAAHGAFRELTARAVSYQAQREPDPNRVVHDVSIMRGAIIVFVLGVVAGAIGLSYLKQQRGQESRALSASTAPSSSAETGVLQDVRDATISASDAAARKLDDWNLNSEDVKADLRNTGSVVRTKARAAGETIATVASKARVIGTIKAKYTLDNDLNARSINVDFDNGKVTLNGSVPSEAAIGKAVALALDTDGVTEVQSLLKVDGATS